ncbi:MAG: DsrE/DsrF/DrsH-like family protein [Candidatus Krumholzibacteriia bacterium]|nr:DsrE/DsrF/DrsH-like family protein [bacterium]
MDSGSLNILVISGARDRLITAANLAASALALGRAVNMFLTWEAMSRFADGTLDRGPLPDTVAETAAGALAGQPSLEAMLQSLRESGLTLYACSNTIQMVGLDTTALTNRVDGISGAAAFLAMAAGGQIVSL